MNLLKHIKSQFMLYIYIILFFMLCNSKALCNTIGPIKVAVIDTAITQEVYNHPTEYHLCKDNLHKGIISSSVVNNSEWHADMIIKTINKYALDSNYCIILINALDQQTKELDLVGGMTYANTLDIDIINSSVGGYRVIPDELPILKTLLNKGITFVAAAGNGALWLPLNPFYPAMYDPRIIVVGHRTFWASNYGDSVDYFIDEVDSGMTSMATAKVTGTLINRVTKRIKECFP